MTTLYWFYLVPVLARIMGCIGVLLALFACYIYIQFYNYDRCEYYSNTYHKWFTDAIDVDKYNITVKVDDEDDKYNEMTIRLGIKNAIQRHLRHSSLHNNNVKIEGGGV